MVRYEPEDQEYPEENEEINVMSYSRKFGKNMELLVQCTICEECAHKECTDFNSQN